MIEPQKAQSPGGAGQSANETSTTQIINAAENLGKLETSLISSFALRGVSIHRLADGGYLACQWAHTRHCRDLRELTAFARQVGALA